MKTVNIFLAVLLLLAAGCRGNIQMDDDLITVDVTKSYPKKELILQDFMDVEYIALETGGDFYTQGVVMAVGKEIIIVKNRVNDGDIFIFDRNGKGLRKINRKGNGNEEYISIPAIILDEDNNEMFINSSNRILVYDLFGNFKRRLLYKEGSTYKSIRNFDRENLICNDESFDKEDVPDKSPFVIISKQDGSITKDIQIPYQQKISTTKSINHNGMIVVAYTSNSPTTSIIPYHDSWILTVYSTDTVFRYSSEHNIPFMVKTPSIESMNPEIYLSLGILTERYFFLQTEKMEPEIKGTTPYDSRVYYPTVHLVYDRQEKSIYEYTVNNDDFSTQSSVEMMWQTINNEIAFTQKLEADDLYDACKEGQLKGKLKEVAAKLKEEDNPVIMLVKHKK